MAIEIDNYDEVVSTLNGNVNATIITTDGRLPALLCKKTKNPHLYITEDTFKTDTVPKDEELKITVGDEINRRDLIETLRRFGREFTVNGEVIDIHCDDIVRIIFYGNKIEIIKTVMPRSFTRIKDLNEFTVQSNAEPTPIFDVTKIEKLIKGKKTLVFENPDEFHPDIKSQILLNKISFDNHVCIGFQMIENAHNVFDVAKTIVIKSDFTMPNVGDLVVHSQHGVGKYMGTKKMRITKDSPEKNYLIIEYSRKSTVYLPIDRTNILSNYHGYSRRTHSLK